MPFVKTHTIYIDAPPERVYDYVSDLNNHPAFAHEKMEMKAPSGSAPVGTTFESSVKFGTTTAAKGTVVEATRPSRFVFESKDVSGSYRWHFDMKPEGSGTLLSYTQERIKAPLYVLWNQALLFYPLFGKKMIDSALVKIKAAVEGQRAAV